jgi:flagellar assembly factor FliW
VADRTISTGRFGEVTVSEEAVIQVPDGLLGFVQLTELVLLPVDEDGLFTWLQAVTDPATAFLGVTPWTFFPDYEPALSDVDQDALGLDDAEDAIVFCLLTSHDDPPRFTTNLLGPVVINKATRVARQVVIDADLPTQAPLPVVE